MKKILQVVACLELGGTEAFIMNNYRVLNKENYQFDFMVFVEKEYPYKEEIEKLGGKIFFSGPPALNQLPHFLKRFKEIVEQNGPYDAIHSHINIDNCWVMYAASKEDIPIRVSHSHDTKISGRNLLVRIYSWVRVLMIKKFATHKLACSEMAGECLYGKKYYTENGLTIPNGIDIYQYLCTDSNAVDKLRQEFNISPQCNLILGNITRFEPKKNQLFIIDVFECILNMNPDAILILGGPDGGQLTDIRNKVVERGIAKSVRFIGKRTDVPLCMKLIDVFIFPSLYEGLPFVVLEAQAAGCICVASAEISHETDMGMGSLKFVSLEESPGEWAKKILKLTKEFTTPSEEVIKKHFINTGFEIHEAHRKLMCVYDGK